MIEIRMHGRGGQGAVVACKILASALYKEGKYAQSFPAFGVERRGAPVMAYTRIDTEPIRLRCEIYEPDHLVILDPTLIGSIPVTAGLKPRGTILVNSDQDADALGLEEGNFVTAVIDAASIAVKHHLGSKAIPIVNTAILGAFARFTGVVGIDAIVEAIRESAPARKAENVAATMEAYNSLREAAKR
ncbi:MAG: 2-oxoacid:acceptor oxidoreductase family protein [Armatimonadetes bacterium]|nr:2-oxoacid:acceptor oxidoreductase family protein [Armatimonadota bacterium]